MFTPHNENDLKSLVIAEAVVLGKGGLKQLLGENQQFTMFKLKNNNEYLEFDDFIDSKGNKVKYEELDTKVSDYSYFSQSGIWLFTSNAKNSISNFKIVLIKENSKPNSYFLDNVSFLTNQVQELWKTKLGIQLYNYIYAKVGDDKYISKLKYEDILEEYKLFINELYNNKKYNDFISITPYLNDVADNEYSVASFNAAFENNPSAFEKYFGDFRNKDKVAITKVQLVNNNTEVYVEFALKTNSFLYQLSIPSLTKAIKLSDVNYTNQENSRAKNKIILEVDSNYLNTVANNSNANNFINNIDKKNIFSNLNENDFNKLNIELSFDKNMMQLNIDVSLKVQYVNDYIIEPANVFNVLINAFGINGNDNNDSNDKNTQDDIFTNITPFEINLNGIKGVQVIKDEIIKQTKEKLVGLEYGIDYEISNLNTVAVERDFVNLKQEGLDIPFSVLNIVSKKAKTPGVLKVKVYNYIIKFFEKEVDLANIKIDDLEINESTKSKIINKVKEYVVSKLSVFNLDWETDYEIKNFNLGIDALALGNNSSFKFVISSKIPQVKNSTAFYVTNIAKEVIDDTNSNNDDKKVYKYDLSKVDITLAQTNYYVLSKLRQSIYDNAIQMIYDTYGLKIHEHYDFNYDELDSVVRNLGTKNKDVNQAILNIYPFNKKSYNQGIVRVSNLNDLHDIIDDLKENPLNKKEIIDNHKQKEQNDQKNKQAKTQKLMLIFIPLGVFSVIGIALLGWWIYVRKFKNKVK